MRILLIPDYSRRSKWCCADCQFISFDFKFCVVLWLDVHDIFFIDERNFKVLVVCFDRK